MMDSHAHVADKAFDIDRSTILEKARAAGVNGWIEVGTDVAESEQAIKLAEQYDTVWATVGVHPSSIGELNEASWDKLEELVRHPKVVAVGEVGFDFYRGGSKEEQSTALRRFVDLAHDRSLPMVFHIRDPAKSPAGDRGASPEKRSLGASAHEAMLEFLDSLPKDRRPRGVIHTFSGRQDHAQRYLALGLYLSFSGVITFDKADELVAVARTVPMDRLLIETDCPYLTPAPYRGKRNEPAYVRYVAEKIAQVRGVEVSAIDQATEHNTRRLFGL